MTQQTKRACSACRQPGHRATNPICPEYGKQPGARPAIPPPPMPERFVNEDIASSEQPRRGELAILTDAIVTSNREAIKTAQEVKPSHSPTELCEPPSEARHRAQEESAYMKPSPRGLREGGPLARRYDAMAELTGVLRKALTNQPGWQDEANKIMSSLVDKKVIGND